MGQSNGVATKRAAICAAVVLALGLVADLMGITSFTTGRDLRGIVDWIGPPPSQSATPSVSRSSPPAGKTSRQPGKTAVPEAPPQPRTEYLTQVEAASNSTWIEGRVANIDGNEYQDTLFFPCGYSPAETDAVYSLGGAGIRFTAIVGIEPSNSADYRVPITIQGDDRILSRFTISVGHARKVNVDLKGVKLLRLACGDATDSRGVTYAVAVAWGDAAVTRR